MTPEKLKVRKERFLLLDAKLKELFPEAHIALQFSNPWELLVAVVLSAQCTDTAVNNCTSSLFRKYSTLADYLRADLAEFSGDVKSITFFNNKAKNILASAQRVHTDFGDQVPQTMAELLTLPGVARKSANIILGNAYGVVEGIAVDTHVRRLALKFDLTDSTDPVKIEKDLMDIIPQSEWFSVTYRLIDYGRKVCTARKHDCTSHPLTQIYPQAAGRSI
jgi:endonuclease-3